MEAIGGIGSVNEEEEAGGVQSIVGIDFAANKDGTWAASGQIESSGCLSIVKIENGITDSDIVRMIEEEPAVVAIDVPFGWPHDFVSFVSQHHQRKIGPHVSRVDFRYRLTDKFVQEKTSRWPLSVSTDKLGILTHRMAALMSQLKGCDIPPLRVSGNYTKVIEVYPRATLAVLGLQQSGYKSKSARNRTEASTARGHIVTELAGHGVEFSGAMAETCRHDPDALDACICALTARLYLEGTTWNPLNDPEVRKEGWIFFPKVGT